MKNLFILVLVLITLASCSRREVMVTPVGSHIRVQAYNTHDLPLMTGDTIIMFKIIGTVNRGKYFIANEFLLRESWVNYDSSSHDYYGREYYKAVVF